MMLLQKIIRERDGSIHVSLDDYEAKVLKGSNDCTMDAAIGIGNYANNRVTTSRLMLVELRMGYDNVDNLSASSLENKISHSENLLSGHRIDKNNYFIFRDGVAAQRERRLVLLNG